MPRNKDLNEQMRKESRKKILDTAGRLFSQQGYFSVRIADIARAAEMSPGNIYWYYPGKEEILKAILQNVFDQMEQILVDAASWPGSGLDKLTRIIDLELANMKEHGALFQIYMSILGHGGAGFFKELGFDTVQIGLRYHQHLSVILRQAAQEGSISPIDPYALTVFFFAFFNGLVITYGDDWQQIPEAVIRQAVLQMLGKK